MKSERHRLSFLASNKQKVKFGIAKKAKDLKKFIRWVFGYSFEMEFKNYLPIYARFTQTLPFAPIQNPNSLNIHSERECDLSTRIRKP